MTEKISKEILEDVVRLRKTLHRYPELSGNERQTAGWVKAFLEKQGPERMIENIGGHGLAAIFDSGQEGPTILFRADLDALPIQEVNTFDYKSQHEGVSHKCGHDGHTAILAGVAAVLGRERPDKGRVVLLFQGEEETGQGAEKVIRDPLFQEILPDQVYALHNLPGYPEKAIVIKDGPFASASKGMIIELTGRSSHAAHPEQGNSPGLVLPELIGGLQGIPAEKSAFRDFVLLTIIHVKLGELAFGTNPGKGVVMATLRSFLNDDMKVFTRRSESLVKTLADRNGLEASIRYTEVFPATHNQKEATETVRKAAKAIGARVLGIEEPFRWSEDFGHFTQQFPGALFGIGSGEKHPSLHNNDYDFPDEIIETGIAMFLEIARLAHNK
jgi:amidohydrolase